MRVILVTTADIEAECTITCLRGLARGSCCQVRSTASSITPASSSGRHQAVHLGPASFLPSPDSLHNHVWALQRLTSRADVLYNLPLHNTARNQSTTTHEAIANQASLAPVCKNILFSSVCPELSWFRTPNAFSCHCPVCADSVHNCKKKKKKALNA